MTLSLLSTAKLGLASSLGLALLGFAGAAQAQEACGDQTCDAGFECKTYTVDCAAISCLEGEDCCEPGEQHYCERAECETDADCGDYMVCGTFQSFCGEILIDCAEGVDCAPPDQGECEETEYQQCAPSWELPCEADSDCGEGFACKSYEVCDCATAGAPPSEERAAEAERAAAADEASLIAPDEPVECNNCRPSEDKWCEVIQTACSDDSDCPTDWTCVENYGLCYADADGEVECEEPDPAMICQPPYDRVYPSGGVLEAADGVTTSDLADGDVAVATVGTDDSREDAVDLDAEEESDDGVIENDDVMTSPENGDTNASSGCSVAAPNRAPIGGLTLMALGLGAIAGLRRRTRR